MTSDELAGEASFSTFNIRRRGQMAPKAESGAFWFSRTGHPGEGCGPAAGAQRGRRPEGRARVPERGALERQSTSRGTRTVTTEEKQARACGRRRCGDCRSWGYRRRPARRPGRSLPPGRAGHRRADVTTESRFGSLKFGSVKLGAGVVEPIDRLCSASSTAAYCRTGPVGSGPIWPGPVWSGHRPESGQLLVDSAVSGDAVSRAHADQRRGCSLLACPHRRQQVSFDTSGRREPHLRRPDHSSSSHLDRDVPSASMRLAES